MVKFREGSSLGEQVLFPPSLEEYIGRNVQAAVDVDSRMVVGGYATKATCDHGELPHVIREIEETAERTPQKLSADRGYALLAGLHELATRSIEGFISMRGEDTLYYSPSQFTYDSKRDEYTCPKGKTLVLSWKSSSGQHQYRGTACSICDVRQQCLKHKRGTARTLLVSPHAALQQSMRERMKSPLGKQMAQIRSATVEPTFGTIKYAKKLRRFCFRGLAMVNSLWKLELAAFNLEKLAKRSMMNAVA